MEKVDVRYRDTELTHCGLVLHLVSAFILLTTISVCTANAMFLNREMSVGDIVVISVTVSVSLLWMVLTVVWYNKLFWNLTSMVISCMEAPGFQTIASESTRDKASEPMIPTVVVIGFPMPLTKVNLATSVIFC